MFGFSAYRMPIETYGKLMDMGFRRSGKFFYKPDVLNGCCPQYTIRLDVKRVKVNKEQRKTLRNFNRFACGGETGEKKNTFDLEYEVRLADNDPWTITKEKKQRKGKAKFAPLKYQTCRPNFRTELQPASFTTEKYLLYVRYQIAIHHDEPWKMHPDEFKNFLCLNPFLHKYPEDKTPLSVDEVAQHGGTIHQAYYYNDELIAFAVLDVIPGYALSSVYFVWDPDYSSLGFGKVSALREIVLARDLHTPYYYMGFYIPECTKMMYKAEFQPSELLDPQSLPGHPQWFGVSELEANMDENLYATLEGERKIPERQLPPDDYDETEGRWYFELKLPGVLDLATVKKTDYMSSLVNFQFGDNGFDENFNSLTSESYLSKLASHADPRLVSAVLELRATIGSLAEDFAIVLSL